jgi:hypothetical protein
MLVRASADLFCQGTRAKAGMIRSLLSMLYLNVSHRSAVMPCTALLAPSASDEQLHVSFA